MDGVLLAVPHGVESGRLLEGFGALGAAVVERSVHRVEIEDRPVSEYWGGGLALFVFGTVGWVRRWRR